ncbi:MAG TPA: SDR family NAD(P)-dependent oxidoreductase [Myxococcota bacterium]|nr:SDR family NAD(P)-dependent oxidoreductase [Myxococcota bacterium]
MSERVLVLGATSGIGRALVRALAAEGAELVLAGRDADALDRIGRDAWVRSGRAPAVETFDARDHEGHEAFLDACFARAGGLDGIVVCHGVLVEQARAERDPAAALAMLDVNVTGTLSLLEGVARRLEAAGSGWIAALSSVAGDRGRRRNYLYGASKAALSTALEGLRVRLAPAGIAVVDVRPGPVDTAMTFGAALPGVASPERVARDLLRGVRRRRAVVYTPWPWRFVMLVVRWLPAPLVARLDPPREG